MIISHQFRFIFIKTVKSAGTSLEIALSQYCGNGDVITPIRTEDEQLRYELGLLGPQNFKVGEDDAYYNHIDALSVKKFVGETIWGDYFKFCFERNPWDKVISWYYWRTRNKQRPTLAEFVRSPEMEFLRDSGGINLYTIEGEVCVDRVFQYGDMEAEVSELSRLLQLPNKLKLPRTKSKSREDRRHYCEVYDEQSRAIVGDMFEKEIKLFGYSY